MYSATKARRRDEPMLDRLPELTHYADTGCEAAASCLACPLPQCKFDDPTWYQAYKRADRDRELISVYEQEGLHVIEIARRFGLSTRTVHRAIQRSRAHISVGVN